MRYRPTNDYWFISYRLSSLHFIGAREIPPCRVDQEPKANFYNSYTLTSGLLVLAALISVIISGLFRAKYFLLLDWARFVKRVKRNTLAQVNVASAALVIIISALVVAAFFMRAMRMNLLRKVQPQQITNKYFAGYANLLASSGSSTLLFEQADGKFRYIYAASEYTLAVESREMTFPVLNKP